MVQRITSRENAQVKRAVLLSGSTAARRESGLFFAETPKLVLDICAAGAQAVQVFYTDAALAANPALGALPGEHFLVNDSVAEKLSGQSTPSGACALAKAPAKSVDLSLPGGRYLALERVQDPANVGAMLRTAAAMGFNGVFLTKDCADPFSQKALRASMGAAVKLPLHYVGNMAAFCRELAGLGVETAAARMDGAVSLENYAPAGAVAVLVGSEGQGLSAAAMAAASAGVRIPMAPGTESLNAAVAASVFMWQLRRV